MSADDDVTRHELFAPLDRHGLWRHVEPRHAVVHRHHQRRQIEQDTQWAVQRIQEAVVSGEKVLIYGDYDVDGTTAVALVYSFFTISK